MLSDRKVWDATGTFGIEVELIADRTMEKISKRSNFVTFSISAGSSGDVIFLYTCDICGEVKKPLRKVMPPLILNAPVGRWFSCLTQTTTPAALDRSGQSICDIGCNSLWTKSAAASISDMLNMQFRYQSVCATSNGRIHLASG